MSALGAAMSTLEVCRLDGAIFANTLAIVLSESIAREQVECRKDFSSSLVTRNRTSAVPVNFQTKTAKAKSTVASRSLFVQDQAFSPSSTRTACEAHGFCCCCVDWPSWHGKGEKSSIAVRTKSSKTPNWLPSSPRHAALSSYYT
jgi:hypothetical protein